MKTKTKFIISLIIILGAGMSMLYMSIQLSFMNEKYQHDFETARLNSLKGDIHDLISEVQLCQEDVSERYMVYLYAQAVQCKMDLEQLHDFCMLGPIKECGRLHIRTLRYQEKAVSLDQDFSHKALEIRKGFQYLISQIQDFIGTDQSNEDEKAFNEILFQAEKDLIALSVCLETHDFSKAQTSKELLACYIDFLMESSDFLKGYP